MELTPNYFVKKFSNIPESKWAQGMLVTSDGRCCVLGHCGVRHGINGEKKCDWVRTPESDALVRLFDGEASEDYVDWAKVYRVNDGEGSPRKNVIKKLKRLPTYKTTFFDMMGEFGRFRYLLIILCVCDVFINVMYLDTKKFSWLDYTDRMIIPTVLMFIFCYLSFRWNKKHRV